MNLYELSSNFMARITSTLLISSLLLINSLPNASTISTNKMFNSHNTNQTLLSNTADCPTGCICSPTHKNQLRITCSWTSIAEPNIFEAFPVDRTHGLSINCDNPRIGSRLPPGVFAPLGHALQHLSLINCRPISDSLQADTLKGLPNLRTFSFTMTDNALNLESTSYVNKNDQFQNNVKLDNGFLRGCSKIEKLTLVGLGIDNIPNRELCNLNQLKLLNISFNGIGDDSSFGVGDACSLPVVMLDLSSNRIQQWPSQLLKSLPYLYILHLSNNAISEVPVAALSGLDNLRTLSLAQNSVTKFSEQVHLTAPLLETLDLSQNQLAKFPPAITLSTYLGRLNLSNNAISTLSVPEGYTLPALTSLDLSGNKISEIHSEQFSNFTALKHLQLARNDISKLRHHAIKDLEHLEIIDLSNNKLASLRHDSFFRLTSMNNLNLAGNSLAKLSNDFFSGMTSIKVLDISGNEFMKLPTALQVLYYIEQLDASGNKITAPSNSLLERLPNLASLDLGNNKLDSIGRNFLENVPKLTTLKLSDNKIKFIDPNSFYKSNSLAEINLSNNQLQSLKGFVANLPEFKRLNASNNQITQLDYSMIPTSLQILDISYNGLSRISNFLGRKLGLQHLNVSHNLVRELGPEALPQSLVDAHFANNLISTVSPGTLLSAPLLKVVDLRHNQISELSRSSVTLPSIALFAVDDSSFSQASHVKLYLEGNPLSCSCNTEWLRLLLPSRSSDSRTVRPTQSSATANVHSLPMVADLAALSCSPATTLAMVSGRTVSPIPLISTTATDFLCQYDMMCSEDCICCDFDSCDCKSVCPPGCTCYRDASHAENIVQCSGNPLVGSAETAAPFTLRTLPMYATEIFLDGVRIPVLEKHTFLGRFRLKALHLNSSGIVEIEPAAFAGLTSLFELNLSNNRLTKLTGAEFRNVPKLKQLDLSANNIESIDPRLFQKLGPSLVGLNLAQNQLRTLDSGIGKMVEMGSLSTLTLSGNNWACDCDRQRFFLQTWLPKHTSLVPDHQAVYCFENLTEPESEANDELRTILRILPASTARNTVKVNFWTFLSEIMPQFCEVSPDDVSVAVSNNNIPTLRGGSLTSFSKPTRPVTEWNAGTGNTSARSLALIITLVCSLGLLLFCLIIIIVWRFRAFSGTKMPPPRIQKQQKQPFIPATISSHPKTYSTPPLPIGLPPLPELELSTSRHSDKSTCSTSVGMGNLSSSSPFLNYDAFVAYSLEDACFVAQNLSGPLEKDQPYYELCLMHRDIPVAPVEDSGSAFNESLLDAMGRAQRIVLVLSAAFLRRDWRLSQFRAALQYVLRDAPMRHLIVILAGDVPMSEIDPVLGHYIRTSLCIQYDHSPRFWHKLHEALPDKNAIYDRAGSIAEEYGSVVPSDFV